MARIPGLYRRGRVWWCKFYVNGCPVRESTGTEKETEAKRILDARRERAATGRPARKDRRRSPRLQNVAEPRTRRKEREGWPFASPRSTMDKRSG
jgi:hypothetical protein